MGMQARIWYGQRSLNNATYEVFEKGGTVKEAGSCVSFGGLEKQGKVSLLPSSDEFL